MTIPAATSISTNDTNLVAFLGGVATVGGAFYKIEGV
jgi:hypothetical protein